MAAMRSLLALLSVALALLSGVEAFAPRRTSSSSLSCVTRVPSLLRTGSSPMLRLYSFSPRPGDDERKITRENDAEAEFFESEFDRTPLKERLPVALGFLAAVSLPFIIGLVYLYTNK